MKSILLLMVLIATEKSCSKQDQLPLLKATSQAWSGGAAGSGRGTNYEIWLQVKDMKEYTFDSLWVQDKRLPVEVNERRSNADSLLVTSTDMTQMIRNIQDFEKAGQVVPAIPLPIPVTAAAVLGYHYKGKQGFLMIPEWIKLKPIYYP